MTVTRATLTAWSRAHLVFREIGAGRDDILRRLDLARPIVRGALDPVHARLPGTSIAVVTAANPGARPANPEANERARAALGRAIAADGHPAIPCDGCSPDGAHREAGFAIACGESIGLALARRFGQAGFYLLVDHTASIVLRDATRIDLPRLEPGLRCISADRSRVTR